MQELLEHVVVVYMRAPKHTQIVQRWKRNIRRGDLQSREATQVSRCQSNKGKRGTYQIGKEITDEEHVPKQGTSLEMKKRAEADNSRTGGGGCAAP